MYITFLQISQMIAGVVITLCGFHYVARDSSTCGLVPRVLYFQGLIYGSYLYLFLDFLMKRFFPSGKVSYFSSSSSSSFSASSLPPSCSATALNGATGTGIEKGGQRLAAGEGAAAPAANGDGYESDIHLKKAQ